ncbi:MAG: hypBA [Chthoniobacteraceae bacterium]|nr:hypBA [Chthoniobacteraceae bacterium]
MIRATLAMALFSLIHGFALSEEPAGSIQAPAALDRAPETSSILTGPVGGRVRAVIDNWLLLAPDQNPAMLAMFADRDREPYRSLLPWSGEFAGKYLTACAEVIRLTGDIALKEKVQKFVNRFIQLQDDDGYLGPLPRPYRLAAAAPNVSGGTWDAWGHYHAMLGLIMWHDLTGDDQALHCAQKIGDLLCNHFLGGGRHVADIGSPDQNQAVIHGLSLLYEKTNTKRYLALAEQVAAEFEIPGAGDYLRTALAGTEFYATPKPRWESLHAIMGLAELYRITGKESYRRGFEQIWWSIVKLDRHNNGGFSSGEQAVGNPYNGAPIETCCTIAWLASSVEMLRITGNSVVADEMELSTLNSILGLHSPDGKWSTYNTPMDGRRVPNTEDISFQIRPGAEQLNCCSVNAARGFGMISDWALMNDPGRPASLILNWYGPSTFSSTIAGTQVTLRQLTDYPRNGRIELIVDPALPAKFALKLRIPYWSTATRLKVNDTEISTRAGTYCTLDRTWAPGDRIIIELDMRLRAWSGERECAGKASLYRGPLLLAFEEPQNSASQRPGKWKAFGKLFASKEKGAVFEAGFEGEGIKWFGHYFDDAGKARVVIDGQEVAVVDQYGPVRETPFSWEKNGLSPGRHTIQISVTGDKITGSRDTWCNVLGFGKPGSNAPGDFTPLDLTALSARLIESGVPESAFVAMDVSDSSGHTVRLRDFASAGRDGLSYISWLRAEHAQATAFSLSNPLRSAVLTSPSAP